MEMNRPGSGPVVTLPPAAELIKAKAQQGTKRIIAATMSVVEEMADEHDNAMSKLRAALPKDYQKYVDLADWMNEARFEGFRARISKVTNDAYRDLEDMIDKAK